MVSHDEDGIKAWGYARFDWTVHFAYAGVFAYQPIKNWFESHPLYYDTQFSYPFLADALSGLLIRQGSSYVNAFLIPSVITSIILVLMLYTLYFFVLKKPEKAVVAISLFFTTGGLGFIWFIKNWIHENGNTALRAVSYYTQMADKNIEWLNIFPGELIPQRAFLLGLPVTLFVILVLWRWFQNDFKTASPIKLILLGITGSMVMLIHVHSYMVLINISAIFSIYTRQHWRKWLIFALAAALPSFIFYVAFYGNHLETNHMNRFFFWNPGGFMTKNETFGDWLYFWILNWGLFFPLALWTSFRKKMFLKNPLILTALVLFIAANLIQFQPNSWDNAKIFTWSYLLFSIPIAEFIVSLWQKRLIGKIVSVLIFFTLTFSGGLDLIKLSLTNPKYNGVIINNEDILLAEKFRAITQPEDIVLTSGKNDHWVATHTGRRILWGEKAFLWTYGIDTNPPEQDVKKMFAGGEEAKMLLAHYSIDLAVIGPTEISEYQANENFFKENYELILQSNQYAIYKIE